MFNKENIFPTKPIKTIKELNPYIPLLENLMLTNRTQEEISSALMCDLAVLNEYAYLTYELSFLDLLETFRARSNALLLDKQYERALEGDNKMLIFLGKNYARLLASVDTTTVIVPDEEHNNKPDNSGSENIPPYSISSYRHTVTNKTQETNNALRTVE